MSKTWGLCRDCKWWKIEPDGAIENLTMGICIDNELTKVELRVSGNSGCNRFVHGKPPREKGASEIPSHDKSK